MTEPKPTETFACNRSDLVANSGIALWIGAQQIALFYLPDETPQLYAVSNFDPVGQANVIARGIIAEHKSNLTVTSPLYKQKYCLNSGRCLDEQLAPLATYSSRVMNDEIYLTL